MFAGMGSWSRTLAQVLGIRGSVAFLPMLGRAGHSPYPVLTHGQLLTAAGLIALTVGFALRAPLVAAIVINGVLAWVVAYRGDAVSTDMAQQPDRFGSFRMVLDQGTIRLFKRISTS